MINIVVADDHAILVEGMVELLSKNPNYNIVGTAANGQEAVDLVKKHKIDLVLMDINMPILDGIEATKKIVKMKKGVKILVLSMYNRSDYIRSAVGAGAAGYILKNTSPKELDLAIDNVMSGNGYFSLEVSSEMAKAMTDKKEKKKPKVKLSPHEKQLLQLISEGLTSDEISIVMRTSTHTIRSYRRNLLAKFKVKNVSQLMVLAIREQYID